MIEMCMDGARVVMESWKQFLLSPTGVYLYSVVTGVVGIVLLLGFFSMVLSPGAVLILLPLIIAFNAASSGYGLLDKSSKTGGKKLTLFTIGAILAATGLLAVAVVFPWANQVDATRILVSCGTALTGIYFGSWIAVKKQKLLKQ